MNIIKHGMAQYKSFSVQAKASLWFTVSSMTQKIIALITVPLFTRIMSTEQYGIFTLYQSWFSVLLIATTLNLHLAVFSTAMIKFDDDRDRYVSSMVGLTSTLTFCIGVFYLVFRNVLNNLIGLETTIMIVMFIDLLFFPAFNFWAARQRFEFKYRSLIIVTLIVSVVSAAAGVLAVVFTEKKGTARVYSLVIVEIIAYSILYLLIIRKGKVFFSKKYWSYALLFAVPLVPHYLSTTILNQADRIMINKFEGPGKAAIYGVAYSASMLVLLFVNALNASYTPWLYNKLKNKDYSQISDISFDMMVLVGVINAVLVLFAPEIMGILGGKEYQGAVFIFPVLTASTSFIFLFSFFAGIEFYFEKKYYVMAASSIAAILNIFLNYIFIPIYGYYAAAYTTLVCYIFYSLVHVCFMLLALKENGIPNNIYNLSKMFGVAFVIVGWAVVFPFVYKHIIVRNTILAIIVVGCFMYRDKLFSYYKAIMNKLKTKG